MDGTVSKISFGYVLESSKVDSFVRKNCLIKGFFFNFANTTVQIFGWGFAKNGFNY